MRRRCLLVLALGLGCARPAPPTLAPPSTFEIPLPDFFGEGLAWDAHRDRLMLGGIVGQSIATVELPDGQPHPFAEPPSQWSVFGLAVDSEQDVLWAACSAVPQGRRRPDPEGPAAIVGFALEDGRVVATRVVDDGTEHLIGDLVVAPGGRVFATDTLGGGLYSTSLADDTLHAVLPPSTFRSPQGVVARDASTLVVADYSTGLHRVALNVDGVSGQAHLVEPPTDVDLRGIDGLALREQTLVAVQNGAKTPRVLRLELDPNASRVHRAEVLVVPDAANGEPTLATIVEDEVWVMQTDFWPRVFDNDGRPRPDVRITPPTIVRIPLSRG